MPILIEQPDSISAADLLDLEKIYANCTSDLKAQLHAWEHDAALNWQLYTARFNARLLGALWLEQRAGQHYIHALCVRPVTRRRGVARRLLEIVTQQYPQVILMPSPLAQHAQEEAHSLQALANALQLDISPDPGTLPVP